MFVTKGPKAFKCIFGLKIEFQVAQLKNQTLTLMSAIKDSPLLLSGFILSSLWKLNLKLKCKGNKLLHSGQDFFDHRGKHEMAY